VTSVLAIGAIEQMQTIRHDSLTRPPYLASSS
jgi:hypothetical protein